MSEENVENAPEPTTTETAPEVTPEVTPDAEAPKRNHNAVDADFEYDASAITVLEGLEAVRKRPGMYIGSTGERGLHHLVWEIVDNGVDEALAGICDRIVLTLQADGGVRVEDNGRGIPTDTAPGQEMPALTMALTLLHAGGKFGGGGYKVSGGLHGVGVSVVNALSARLVADVKNRGHLWRQSFQLGVPDGDLEQVRAMEPGERTGTTVTWYASEEIFESTHYNLETITSRLREMAFLNKGVEFVVRDEREDAEARVDAVHDVTVDNEIDNAGHDAIKRADTGGLEQVFKYDRGLVDYVEHLNRRKTLANATVISFEADTPDTVENHMSLEVAMQWNTTYTESVHTFANNINTHEGGTHEEGFRASLTSLVNNWGSEWGLIKKPEDRVSGDDIREGLTAIVSIKLAEPQFEGQTKTKLGNTEAKSFVQKVANDQLSDWFNRNPNPAREIIRKALQASNARMAARKARETARRKGLLEGGGMPGKLKDCQSKDPSLSEIFIVEGDSAGGSAVQGRNPEFQAILPLRGKILNVEKARLDRALGNAEVQAMITAFGAGMGEEFNPDKVRYHKIVLMADADVDGQHITTLLLTLLFRYMRPLIDLGYVYLAQPPLYRLKWANSAHEYVYSDRERDALLEDGAAAGKRIPKDNGIQRYKGLGEMDYKELWETTMAPESRTLLQVTLDDAAAADEIFSTLMGEDVESRRNFIQKNAKDVRFLDI